MSTSTAKTKQAPAVQTTGHAWDGDIQEYNNPLPTWWVWGFYATVVFAIIYWVLYPAWPVGDSYTKGVFNTITYESNGQEKTTHWNTRALLMKELQSGEQAKKQQQYMQKIAASDYDNILADPEKIAFVRSVGKVLFADNCAACHGIGGAGKVGLFPNLVDDDWLWGGAPEDILQTLREGRMGFMPAFKNTFDEQQLKDVTEYVLSLSGQSESKESAERGAAIFNGASGGCYYCHTEAGTGLKSQGAANLTDKIWTIADIPSQTDIADKRRLIAQVIEHGVSRQMPAWKGRLSPTEIKVLTLYVNDLGGGQ